MSSKRRVGIARAGMVLAAVAIGYSSLATLARELAFVEPDIAAGMAGSDALVQARLSSYELFLDKPAEIQKGQLLARSALERDISLVDGVRNLGIAAEMDDDDETSLALLKQSRVMTRRDLATSIFLINAHAANDEIEEALASYDIALRSSRMAWQVLTPTLVAATREQFVIPPLQERLMAKPFWSVHFLRKMADEAPNLETASRLFINLAEAGIELQPATVSVLLRRLVGAGYFQDAFRLAAETGAGAGDDASLEWSLNEGASFARNDQSEILLNYSGSEDAATARRLYRLPPGQARVTATYDVVALGRPAELRVRLDCPGASQPAGSQATTLELSDDNTLTFDVTVGDGCRFQEIVVDLTRATGRGLRRTGGAATIVLRDWTVTGGQ